MIGLVVASGLLMAALPAFAATATPTSQQVACIGAAVDAREAAIDNALGVFAQSLTSDYSARATALHQAYALPPGGNAIKNAVKAAWATFNASAKADRTTWQNARNNAWATFRAAAKACKAPTVASDSTMSSSETTGL